MSRPTRRTGVASARTGMAELGSGRIAGVLAVAVVGCLLLSVLLVQSVVGGLSTMLPAMSRGGCEGTNHAPSEQAENGIPADYLRLYTEAAQQYGLEWHVLAGIGRVETNHGRLDAEGVTSGENFAGAGGPMQFLSSTWETYGVDGNGDGVTDRYDPADAIPSAANYLAASGAPENLYAAIFAYNHADWYVEDVLHWASEYATGGAAAVATNFDSRCTRLSMGSVPEGLVGEAIAFAREQLGDPYVWGAEGPSAFDCSGLTMSAFQAAGVQIPRVSQRQFQWGPRVPPGQERPGDLVFFGNPVHHVGLVIGDGKMIEAQQTGVPVKISSYEDRDPRGFTRPLAHEGVDPEV